MNARPEITAETVSRLTLDSDPWLSCDECFEHVDAAVEDLVGSGRAMSKAFAVHLRACPACHDEATSLAELVANDFGLTSDRAVDRLESAIAAAING